MLDIWNKWKPKLVRKISPLMTVTHHKWFAHNFEALLHAWKIRRVNILKERKKGQLLQKHELENMVYQKVLWLYYFQLRPVVMQKQFINDLHKEMNSGDLTTKHKLSTIYKLLINADETPFISTLTKWGRDCEKQFSREDWNTLCSSYMMSTSFLPLWLEAIKLVHRWYLTPKRLHNIFKDSEALCWKGCKVIADYLHCWWLCSQVHDFWLIICFWVFLSISFLFF